jgi:hypothetical protein
MPKENSLNDFGLLIAFVLPGFTVLWGTAFVSGAFEPWLDIQAATPTVGGFLFATLASVAAGLAVSTIRWLTVDRLHHLTGVRRPARDFSQLSANVDAFGVLVEGHYKYYLHAANMFVAVAFVFGARQLAHSTVGPHFDWIDIALIGLMLLYFLGSRDSLKQYYAKTEALLGTRKRRQRSRGGATDTQP